MPLVFASSEETESGIRYDDRTGISYEFPVMYRRLVVPGTPFVYYRGRRRVGGGRQAQVYFGAGVVGEVSASPSTSGRLACDILDFAQFSELVPFRRTDRRPLEPDGDRKGYYQRGVRPISDTVYREILQAGLGQAPPTYEEPSSRGYATAATARLVEDYAVAVAVELLRAETPDAEVITMPRNNPGYDLLVERDGQILRYAEAKGTQSSVPQFFISEGEREFSIGHSNSYSLIIVFSIDLQRRVHQTHIHQGPVTSESFELAPIQWKGRMRGGFA
jgi:hypothetical protein